MNNKHLALTAIPVFAAILMGAAVLVPQAFAAVEKVQICHVNSANDLVPIFDKTATFGMVIVVSENAVAAREANHGDSTHYLAIDGFWIGILEYFGLNLPNADCVFLSS